MRLIARALVTVSTLALSTTAALASEALLKSKCSACHVEEADGELSRISDQRKTPEGWNMTIFRMEQAHGLQLGDDERRTLIGYLADTNGLAPAESEPQRAILERRPAFVESPPDEDLAVLCARCHTWGRVALQRRTEPEWLKHVHFHVGQYPTIEYQALARDRDWFADAVNVAVPALARMFPMDTPEWTAWQAAEKPSPAGDWVVFGHWPGKGDFHATMSASGDAGRLELEVTGAYEDGDEIDAEGFAIVYTGYEWRAEAGDVRQIMAMSEDGNRLTGRWFDVEDDALGGQVVAVRAGSGGGAIGVSPAAVRSGESTSITVYGDGLEGALAAEGIEFGNIELSGEGTVLSAEATVADDAELGSRSLGQGIELLVYDRIDRIEVVPDEAIARVGDNGGPIAAVPAQFDAVAWADGPDGESGTEDDLRIGHVDADWSVRPYDEVAEEDRDAHFAGAIDADTGLFSPAGAGTNPERRFSTNNAGNLLIDASVDADGRQLTGSAHLVVTVQRFNDPPIR